MTRFRVHVEDDFIHAEDEEQARVAFIQSLTEDRDAIEVSEEPDDDE